MGSALLEEREWERAPLNTLPVGVELSLRWEPFNGLLNRSTAHKPLDGSMNRRPTHLSGVCAFWIYFETRWSVGTVHEPLNGSCSRSTVYWAVGTAHGISDKKTVTKILQSRSNGSFNRWTVHWTVERFIEPSVNGWLCFFTFWVRCRVRFWSCLLYLINSTITISQDTLNTIFDFVK